MLYLCSPDYEAQHYQPIDDEVLQSVPPRCDFPSCYQISPTLSEIPERAPQSHQRMYFIHFMRIDLKGELQKLLWEPPSQSPLYHWHVIARLKDKRCSKTDQGLNIFSSSEWPSAPINAVPRVAMLVHYSSLLFVSKCLKCSCGQNWLNLHFCLKPIWISLLLVNYEKREHKRGPKGTKMDPS